MIESYAIITIDVRAPAEEINGPNELELSDKLYYLEYDLNRWLEKRSKSTPFQFKLKIE